LIRRARTVVWAAGTPVRLVLIGLIRVYQLTLSGWLGGQCRFYPSCSHYAAEAIGRHGAVRGVALAAWRVARCGPFTAGGVDHVPPSRRQGHLYDAVIPKGSAQ
jgi:putative membrane protein insertion efficiency factor